MTTTAGEHSGAVPDITVAVQERVAALRANSAALRLALDALPNGTALIDAGINARGGLEAGRLIAEICMGGLGTVTLQPVARFARWPWQLHVHSSNPVVACLASQYAGWSLNHGEGKQAYYAMGSGPARAMGSREKLYEELGYRLGAADTCLVLEVDKVPPVEIADKVVEYCGITPEQLTLLLTPTTSLAGSVQVVGRVLEVALHKAHELGFALDDIVDGAGTAPVCPPGSDFLTAMGRTNDAILFGGHVQLFVAGDESSAADLARQLPSATSDDFGRPFAEVFKATGYDFYKIDPMLFSPASVAVTALETGRTFHAGELREDLLDSSFGGGD